MISFDTLVIDLLIYTIGPVVVILIAHIRDVLLKEAAPGLIRGFTVTFISLIGFSAMSGMVGGGGVGNIAIQYGYYRYETGVMLFTIVVLVLFVQLVQYLGDKAARRLTR